MSEKRSSIGAPIIITPTASTRQSKANMIRRQLSPQPPGDSEISTEGNSKSNSKSSSVEKNKERVPKTQKSYNNRYLANLQPQNKTQKVQELESINIGLLQELEEYKNMNTLLLQKNKEHEIENEKLKTQLELFILDYDRPQCFYDAQARYSNMGEELEYLTEMMSSLIQDVDFKNQQLQDVRRDYVNLLNSKSKEPVRKMDTKEVNFKIKDLQDAVILKDEELDRLSTDNSHMLTLLEDYTIKLAEKQDKIEMLDSQLKQVQKMLVARIEQSSSIYKQKEEQVSSNLQGRGLGKFSDSSYAKD